MQIHSENLKPGLTYKFIKRGVCPQHLADRIDQNESFTYLAKGRIQPSQGAAQLNYQCRFVIWSGGFRHQSPYSLARG